MFDGLKRLLGFGGDDAVHGVPDGLALYAIGDIHGELELLTRLLELIRADAAAQPPGTTPVAIFIGDYVDRGLSSRGVVELLSGEPLPGFRTHFLLGNHEQAMLDFLADPVPAAAWLEFGGVATLDSYGVRMKGFSPSALLAARDDLSRAVPARHLDWLRRLVPSLIYGDYLFVHAGIRPGIPLEEQDRADLLAIRSPFLDHRRRHSHRVVHGHTISPAPDVRPNRIGIDTGAYASGVLTALALAGTGHRFLQARRSYPSG